MLYHKLKLMVERYCDDLADVVRSAALFHLDIAPHVSLAKWSDEPTIQHLRHHFRLPYLVTALEDRASCVILGERPTGAGLDQQRLFVECLPADLHGTDPLAYFDGPTQARQLDQALRDAPEGAVLITVGTFAAQGLSHEGFVIAGATHLILAGTPESLAMMIRDPDPDDPQFAEACRAALCNAMTGIEEIVHVESLVGFSGWPTDRELRDKVYDVDASGRITVSARRAY